MKLEYSIETVGLDRLKSTLRSVESELKGHARATEAISARATGGRSRKGGATGMVSDASRGFDQIGRAARAQYYKEGRDKIRGEQALERQRVRSEQQVERQKTVTIRRSEREQVRAEQRIAREQQRTQRQLMASRASRPERYGYSGRAIVGGVSSGVGRIAGLGGTALALGGGFSAVNAVTGGVDLDKRLRQVLINARAPGQDTSYTPDDLNKRVRQTAMSSAVGEDDITGGLETFVQRTGDIKTAVDNMDVFATVAKATGSSMEDVASTAADLMQKFDIKKTEDMAQAFSVLAYQGKKGAFELKDMAQQFPELAAAAQRVGMKGVGGMRTLGGLAQIGRSALGSGAETSTALQMALAKLVQSSGDLQSGKALGGRSVKVFADKGKTQMRDVREVIADVISGSRGNQQQLNEIFDQRGIRAVSPLISKYNDVSKAAGGGKAGDKAGRAAIMQMIEDASNAGAGFKDVQEDFRLALGSTSSQLEILNSKLKAAIASELVPALTKLIPEVTKLVPYMAKAAKYVGDFAEEFAQHPIKGILELMAASVAKDIAGGMISKTIAEGLSGLFKRAPMPGGGAGAGVPLLPGAGGSLVTGSGGGVNRIPAPIAGAAALAGAALAMDQADKLQGDLGTKGNLADILPGVKGGKFSVDTLMGDTLTPWAPASRFAGAAVDTIAGAHDIGRPDSEKWQKTMHKGVGAAGGGQPGGGIDNKPLVDAGAALVASADALKLAAAEVGRSSGGRSGAPVQAR